MHINCVSNQGLAVIYTSKQWLHLFPYSMVIQLMSTCKSPKVGSRAGKLPLPECRATVVVVQFLRACKGGQQSQLIAEHLALNALDDVVLVLYSGAYRFPFTYMPQG